MTVEVSFNFVYVSYILRFVQIIVIEIVAIQNILPQSCIFCYSLTQQYFVLVLLKLLSYGVEVFCFQI